jgi:polysaccharide biosynthesis/export protein
MSLSIKTIQFILIAVLAGLTLSGCIGTQRLVYFQNLPSRPDSLTQAPYAAPIQPGDLLAIDVSSLNSEASAFFNPYANSSVQRAGQVYNPNAPLPAADGYVVAPNGSITLPLAGTLVVAGLANTAAADRIRQRLQTYLKEPTVSVRNLNFRITVLGEVARPSMFTIQNERITLPQALGLAGDLTLFGRRDNVLVMREENNQRTYARLDLASPAFLQSPYYYLHPNDVVYVEPRKARVASTNVFYQLAPVVLSALSLLTIIITNR